MGKWAWANRNSNSRALWRRRLESVSRSECVAATLYNLVGRLNVAPSDAECLEIVCVWALVDAFFKADFDVYSVSSKLPLYSNELTMTTIWLLGKKRRHTLKRMNYQGEKIITNDIVMMLWVMRSVHQDYCYCLQVFFPLLCLLCVGWRRGFHLNANRSEEERRKWIWKEYHKVSEWNHFLIYNLRWTHNILTSRRRLPAPLFIVNNLHLWWWWYSFTLHFIIASFSFLLF